MPLTQPVHTFAELGLSPHSLATLEKCGFEAPTPIQARAIRPALAGHDVIGCAATGTGKTAAFLLPILEKLGGKHGQTRALVLAPTRELALQIGDELTRFSSGRARGATVIGGVGMQPQIEAFRRGTEVIIATPGRLNDHLDQRTAKLDHVEFLVLDEADRMLDMGFKPQLDRILAKLPPKRQTLLFSATMAGEVADFAARHLHAPVRVEVERSGTAARRADQRLFHVAQEEKTALLFALLAEVPGSCLVFTRTKARADRLAKALARGGHEVAAIHADRSQGQRKRALDAFKSGEVRVLVATDIAARGIDVEEIGHVVNFDLSNVPADYVHRIGRTARAGLAGLASSFCCEEEKPLLKDIERLLGSPIPRAVVPRDAPAFVEELERSAAARAHHAKFAHPGGPRGGHGPARPRNPSHGPRRGGSGGGGGHGRSQGGGGRHGGGHASPQRQAPAAPAAPARPRPHKFGL